MIGGYRTANAKRLFAHIIEDVTLVKLPDVGTTRIHVRFKGGKTETLTIKNPKSSAQQVKTEPQVIEFVDALLETNTYPEIAAILNERQVRPRWLGPERTGRSPVYSASGRLSRQGIQASTSL